MSQKTTGKHVIIAGAGAAGLTAAIFAAGAGAKVTLLERTNKAGKKILMSGGTRCNVLPVVATLDDYHTSSSKNLLKRIFKTWSVDGCKQWFTDDIGLKLACENESNKWFPESNSAKEVRDLMLQKAEKLGVRVVYDAAIDRLEQKGDGGWVVNTKDAGRFEGDAVIIATGGLSVPTIGTDGMGHVVMHQLGHKAGPVYPALTPLTGDYQPHKDLSGLSLNVQVDVYSGDKKTTEANRSGFLFTHKGYSGPAVLDVSHFRHPEYVNISADKNHITSYLINWDGADREEWDKRLIGKGNVAGVLANFLPRRLAELIAKEAGLEGRKVAEIKKNERKKLLKLLTAYPLPVSGDEGYRKAEVTGGGVPLDEINTATMESRKYPGLFLCGEIMDVFGRIGGFNFYWAWVSGRLAGLKAGGE
ncbi:MAG: aminoacetone oxidase family FAD-binding enzyme [Balneolia bacterium]|nr:aminoacetone oxidase family FAD-binding enzyme [Balneolia bacterium]